MDRLFLSYLLQIHIVNCEKFIRSKGFVQFKWVERKKYVRNEYTTDAQRFSTDDKIFYVLYPLCICLSSGTEPLIVVFAIVLNIRDILSIFQVFCGVGGSTWSLDLFYLYFARCRVGSNIYVHTREDAEGYTKYFITKTYLECIGYQIVNAFDRGLFDLLGFRSHA